MFSRIALLLLVVIAITNRIGAGAEYSLPERVRVLPVAFVPTDEKPPTDDETKLFIRHIQWSQRRYREMLGGDTFELTESTVKVVKGQKPLGFHRQPPERGAPDIVSELLTQLRVSRFGCPYVFCILLMNSKDNFPEGGGRSINGGVNNGGGMMYIASWELTRNSHFQTTLQHELGHAFGLPHVDVYGYDMASNASMSDGETRQRVFEQSIKSVDETVVFPPTKATRWSVTLTAGTSGIVVIRGLQFFDGEHEVCPHMVP